MRNFIDFTQDHCKNALNLTQNTTKDGLQAEISNNSLRKAVFAELFMPLMVMLVNVFFTSCGVFVMVVSTGSNRSETITGGSGADSLYGGGGGDLIRGDNLLANGTFEGNNLFDNYQYGTPAGWTKYNLNNANNHSVGQQSTHIATTDGAVLFIDTGNQNGVSHGVQQSTGTNYDPTRSYNLTVDLGSQFSLAAPVHVEILVGGVVAAQQVYTFANNTPGVMIPQAVNINLLAGSYSGSGEVSVRLYVASAPNANRQVWVDNVNLTATGTPPSGDDYILGGAGADTIYGDGGNDFINAGTENDLVYGGTGNDSILGEEGNDTLYGGDGNDTLSGGAGNDHLYAGAGTNESLAGGAGSDTIYGSSGNDTVYGDRGGTSYADDGNDYIETGAGNDRVLADGGNDTVFGGSGADSLFGAAGDDQLHGDDGDDRLYGGLGNDHIFGGEGVDVISGDEGDDTLEGGAGNDEVFGGYGNDILYGDDGDDSIFTGSTSLDKATAYGGEGDDTIQVFWGDATLFGGTGANSFIIDPRAGKVIIEDFKADNSADGDTYNNDYVDLGGYYNHAKLADWNAGPNTPKYANPLAWLKGDAADGVLHEVAGGLIVKDASGGLFDPNLFNEENTGVACFTAGTYIDTPTGPRLVETLVAGDMVNTLDAGPQPLRWVASQSISAQTLAENPKRRPIRFKAGSLGTNLPKSDLVVSQLHRMLVRSDELVELVGTSEALIAAKHLTVLEGVDVVTEETAVHYYHLLLDGHHLLSTDGTYSESFFIGPQAYDILGEKNFINLLAAAPELVVSPRPPARPFLVKKDKTAFLKHLKKSGQAAFVATLHEGAAFDSLRKSV